MKQFARRVNAMLPTVDYHEARRSYFVHSGRVHSVENVASAVFRDAVLARKPHWQFHEEYAPLLADLDMFARWYLLCALAEDDKPITLYSSREQAQQSLVEMMY